MGAGDLGAADDFPSFVRVLGCGFADVLVRRLLVTCPGKWLRLRRRAGSLRVIAFPLFLFLCAGVRVRLR